MGIAESVNAQTTNSNNPTLAELSLPDPLTCMDGTKVSDADGWLKKRRPEVLKLMRDNVYGAVPTDPVKQEFRVVKEWSVLDGAATCREVDLVFGDSGGNQLTARLLVFLPASESPVGCFLGLNFGGNHTVADDEQITLSESWVRNKKDGTTRENRAIEEGRGSAASRWPAQAVVERGYALATMYYGDIDPDFDDGFQNGIHPLFHGGTASIPDPIQGGSIAAWAWSLSRALDYLETVDQIDAAKVAVLGHSRLGKTSLWAGATDPRFQIVISNNSGCGGAALSRRRVGETVARINQVFPHWFCDQFNEYNDRESEMPVDQHFLMTLMAPRAVYVASATQDQWADPVGEYQSLVAASPVFELFGNPAVEPNQPPPNQPVRFGKIGYHLRTGKHDLQIYDWQNYLDFADQQFDSGK